MDIEKYKICVEAIEEIDSNIQKSRESIREGRGLICCSDSMDNRFYGALSDDRKEKAVRIILHELKEERKEWEERLANL